MVTPTVTLKVLILTVHYFSERTFLLINKTFKAILESSLVNKCVLKLSCAIKWWLQESQLSALPHSHLDSDTEVRLFGSGRELGQDPTHPADHLGQDCTSDSGNELSLEAFGIAI